MNRLHDKVREALSDIAGSAPVPAGLADNAIAAGMRRRRRHLAAAGGVAVVAALAVALPSALSVTGSPSPFWSKQSKNVVYASVSLPYGHWEILDPTTGKYRQVDVGTVSPPTRDLRYAAVTSGKGEKKIGRYESTTGKIRWYDVPSPPLVAFISPDGQFAVGRVDIPGRLLQLHVVILDLGTGVTSELDLDITNAKEAFTASSDLTWLQNSRHFALGNVVFDLNGWRTATLPVPDDSRVLGVRPDGAGMLIQSGPDGDPIDVALTDASGAIVRRASILVCNQESRMASASPGMSGEPSGWPSSGPSGGPSVGPSWEPPGGPSWGPSGGPSWEPSDGPSWGPSGGPSWEPPGGPSWGPSGGPSWEPSGGPSGEPSASPLSSIWPEYSDRCANQLLLPFLGWRGADSILVQGYDRDGSRIAAVDLRTGDQRTVRRMPDLRMVLVIASAEGLSVQARGIAF